MRQSESEKLETIRLVEDSELSVTATVREAGGQNRVEPSGSLTAGTGLADHQHPGLLHLRIQRLPDSEAVRPDHQSSLHRDVGQRSLPASNPVCERTLENGLHLFPGGRLRVVLPIHRPGRLLPLHHRLEAIPDDGSVRCSRDARPRLTSDRRESGAGAASPATAQRQRPVLRVSRVEKLSPTAGIGAHAWGAAVSPDDAGQDRTLSPFDEERRQTGTLLIRGNSNMRSSNGLNTTTTIGITNLLTT